VPLVSLLEEALDDAAEAGAIRPDLPHRRLAGVLLQAISFNVFSLTISGSSLPDEGGAAEDLWDVLIHGIETDGTQRAVAAGC
jgi:hypothetical protein